MINKILQWLFGIFIFYFLKVSLQAVLDGDL